MADWCNDRIQKFSTDGKFLMKFGSSGSGEGQFNRPSGMAVDKDGDIYVTDWLNNLVQVFDGDGNFVTVWTGDATLSKWAELQLAGSPDAIEELDKDFFQPITVDVAEDGRILVLNCRRDRIQVYKKGG